LEYQHTNTSKKTRGTFLFISLIPST